MTQLTVLKRDHEAAEKSNICFKEFNEPETRKVKGHCNCKGLYRGAARNSYNLKYWIPDHVPTVFQNLSGYDPHLFVKKLGKKFNKEDIQIIAESKEKYICFDAKTNVKLAGVTKKDDKEVCKNIQLSFIDIFIFLPSSLD